MHIPEDCLFTEEHEWARVEGGEAVFGLSAYATEQLGGITFIDMPADDEPVEQFEPFAEVESVKAVSEIYAPVSGTVTAVNNKLTSQPELMDADPYGEGWICRVKLDDPDELDDLMPADEYADYVNNLEQ